MNTRTTKNTLFFLLLGATISYSMESTDSSLFKIIKNYSANSEKRLQFQSKLNRTAVLKATQQKHQQNKKFYNQNPLKK